MEKRPRGRPSDRELSRTSLAVALEEFLESGYQALSMDAIAVKAGISKVSLYRRWANKSALMADVFRLLGQTQLSLPSGRLEDQVRRLLEDSLLGDRARNRGAVVLRTLGEILHNPELVALYREHVLEPRLDQVRRLLQDAKDHGELPPTTSLEVAGLLLGGPLLLAQLAVLAGLEMELSQDFVDELVSMLIRALGVGNE